MIIVSYLLVTGGLIESYARYAVVKTRNQDGGDYYVPWPFLRCDCSESFGGRRGCEGVCPPEPETLRPSYIPRCFNQIEKKLKCFSRIF